MWRRLLDSSYDFKHSTAILQRAHRPLHLINDFWAIYIYSSLYSTPICSVPTSNTHIYCCNVVFFFFWLYSVFWLYYDDDFSVDEWGKFSKFVEWVSIIFIHFLISAIKTASEGQDHERQIEYHRLIINI